MNILVTMHSNDPIYEQIKQQIKQKIQKKEIQPHTQMPSVRVLAKELKVGIITVKRAYDDLVQEGYLVAKTAVGYFSLEVDHTLIKKEALRQVKAMLKDLQKMVHDADLTQEDVMKMLREMENNE